MRILRLFAMATVWIGTMACSGSHGAGQDGGAHDCPDCAGTHCFVDDTVACAAGGSGLDAQAGAAERVALPNVMLDSSLTLRTIPPALYRAPSGFLRARPLQILCRISRQDVGDHDT